MKRGACLLLGLVGACAKMLGFDDGRLEQAEENAAGSVAFSEPNSAGASDQGGAAASLAPELGGSPQGGGASEAGGGFGGAPAGCGDQNLDAGEECDGDQLGDATCATAGELAGGELSCDGDCHYDLRGCYAVKSVAVSEHVCAVLGNDKLKCWGRNDLGQLGLGDQFPRGEERNEMGTNLPFVPLGDARVKQVTVGARHTCVLLADNQVRCWGANWSGQLGVPDVELLTSAAEAPALDLGTSETIDRIEAGGWHTCALFASDRLKCWGANYRGQLGLGTVDDHGRQAGDLGELPFVDLGVEHVSQLSGGYDHTCASGPWGIKCWGATSYTHVRPDDLLALGDQPLEMGANLPLVDLGWDSADPVESVASGGWHNCARSEEGSVKCWGDANFGQPGYGDLVPRVDLSELGAQLGEVDLGGSVLRLSAGGWHTCALLMDGGLKCWGGNEWGQLGLGDIQERGAYPDQMGARLPAVDLGPGHTIVDIRAGHAQSCAILDRGRLKCWGGNQEGGLGLGHKRSIGDEPGEMGDDLAFIEL